MQVDELKKQLANLSGLFEESQEQIENLEFMVLEAQAASNKVGQTNLKKKNNNFSHTTS